MLGLGLLTAVVWLVVPGAASAASVSFEENRVTVVAAPGEVNHVTLSTQPGPDDLIAFVADAGMDLVVGEGCVSTTPREARCDGSIEAQGPMFVIHLGDQDDSLVADDVVCRHDGGFFDVSCVVAFGADGDDSIVGSQGVDRLEGGDGNDTISASAGLNCVDEGQGAAVCDRELVVGGPGDDALDGGSDQGTLVGGTGADRLSSGWVTYAARAAPVSVSLNGVDDDGQPGEGDDVAPDVPGVRGGRAADRLVGNDRSQTLIGGPGRDRLAGRGRGDRLFGENGTDALFGGAGSDLLMPGRGEDIVRGDDGRDLFRAKDGARDVLLGGAGRDWAAVDRRLDVLRRIETTRR